MGAVGGEAALDVRPVALGQLGRRALRRPPPAERGRYSSDGRSGRPELLRAGGERLREQRHRLGAGRPSGARPARPARGPRRPSESAAAAPARIRDSSALRWASAREYAARASARAGQIAATRLSRCARRADGAPFTSSRRSGRNTDSSGRAGAADRLSTGDAVHAQRLLHARLDAHLDQVRALVVLRGHGHARHLLPAPHQLAVVRGARRAARAAEVQRLQEVRLAGAVGAGDHGQARAERDLRLRVVAEVPEASRS